MFIHGLGRGVGDLGGPRIIANILIFLHVHSLGNGVWGGGKAENRDLHQYSLLGRMWPALAAQQPLKIYY